MRKTTLSLAILLSFTGLVGCQSQLDQTSPSKVVSGEVSTVSFAQFSNAFIDDLWQLSPTWALYSGKHVNDGYLEIPNEASRVKTLAFVKNQQAKLKQFELKSLSSNETIDYHLIDNLLNSMAWDITDFKSWQWDPSSYNVAGGFAQIINENFAPLDDRLRSVLARMENIPAYYAAARSNISKPTLEHTELAVMQNQGAFSVFSDDLLKQVADSGLSDAEKSLFKSRFDTATKAINEHIRWLNAQVDLLKKKAPVALGSVKNYTSKNLPLISKRA